MTITLHEAFGKSPGKPAVEAGGSAAQLRTSAGNGSHEAVVPSALSGWLPQAPALTLVSAPAGRPVRPVARTDGQSMNAVPPVHNGRRGRPRQRPDHLHADRADDMPRGRRAGHHRVRTVRIARRGLESGQRLGRRRWVVERTWARFSRFCQARVRYGVRADIHLAFTHLACRLITFKQPPRFCGKS